MARRQRGHVLVRRRLRRLHPAGGRRAALHVDEGRWTSVSASTASRGSARCPGWRPPSWPRPGGEGAGRAARGGDGGPRWSSTAWARRSTRSSSSSTATWPSCSTDAGVEIVAPEVGELVTSLDMAGCSLSLTWLDEELEGYWTAPADTPAFRRGNAAVSTRFTGRRDAPGATSPRLWPRTPATPRSRPQPWPAVRSWRSAPWWRRTRTFWARSTRSPATVITASGCPGVRGPPPRPRNGRRAACRRSSRRPGPRSATRPAAPAGSCGGCCWTGWARASATPTGRPPSAVWRCPGVGDEPADVQQGRAGRQDHARCVVPVRGHAGRADGRRRAVGRRLGGCRRRLPTAAEATSSLMPKIGRARPLAERSVGTPDPGAVSMGLIVTAIGEVFDEATSEATRQRARRSDHGRQDPAADRQ